MPESLDDVLEGRIQPGRGFDFETDLAAYAAMDERRAIESRRRWHEPGPRARPTPVMTYALCSHRG